MTDEGRVKEQVKKLLREFGIYYHMPVQNGMGSPTLDFVCCAWGHYVAIETKEATKYPTDRQLVTMESMSTSGGFVFVVRDDESLMLLRCYLELMKPCQSPSSSSELRVVGPIRTTTPSRKRSRKSPAGSI